MEDFHSSMLSFYLDEEAFDKEAMSWLGVKCNLCKLGMHYIFPAELLKKKGNKVGVGPRSGSEAMKKEAPIQTNYEEQEETQPLEHKERTLSIFSQLPEQALLIGKDFNEILSIAFITELVAKKFKKWVSLSKVQNPQPLSLAIPHTLSTVCTTPIIHIQDDPELDTLPSTITTEHPPSPPQP
jgi:hypothetical protein